MPFPGPPSPPEQKQMIADFGEERWTDAKRAVGDMLAEEADKRV